MVLGAMQRHATRKGAELSCELDYAIPFWLCILSWKNPHFVEISTFCEYYRHFVEIYPRSVDIIGITCIYLYFVEIICIL